MQKQGVNKYLELFLGAPKITADGDCSHEINRRLLLGRKVMTNLDSIFKTRDITLPTKVHLVKAMVFLVVMYGCESWTVKKAECQRIDAFELWYWRRLLRVPWTARRSNQSILKEISPGCSLEGMMLKLKLQYFGHLMRRDDSLEKTLMLWGIGAGGEGDDRGWDGWMASPTQWMWVWVNSGSWWWTGRLACCNSWGHKESDTTERLNWTELNRHIWPWSTEWSGAKANRVLPREHTVIANTLPTTQEKTLHMDITRWSIPKSDWLYSLQPRMKKLYTVRKNKMGADCGSDHELLIAKFRLKLEKVRKATRPFRYDLNQILYDYTLEMTNRFKG